MERGSSAVECRTRTQVSPGSNLLLLPFRRLGGYFRSLHWCPSWLSCINEYLTIDSGRNVSDLVVARNCCMARMLLEEAELVSEWTGLPGEAKSVKRFERFNGVDLAFIVNCLVSFRFHHFQPTYQFIYIRLWWIVCFSFVVFFKCFDLTSKLYSRTPVERPPSPTTILLIRPYFVWRTVFSVCAVPDRRPSLKRDQRPGHMEFSPSRTTTFDYSVFPRIAGGASTKDRRRFIVTILPSRWRSGTFVVIKLLWTSRIRGAVIINGNATWCFM